DQLDLNSINLILYLLAFLLHGSPQKFLKATEGGAATIAPILIQYPLYGGIMGVLASTGLAATLINVFVQISNPTTFPLLTFFSAGLLNILIPSGGGQWAIQGAIVIPAARDLGVDLSKAAMAVAWG